MTIGVPNRMKRQLIFENGTSFIGDAFGADAECIADIVVNTAMVGYQEILTDPATTGQMLLMTYPLIGNYGLTGEDNESFPSLSALIVREYNNNPTNYRYARTLGDVMQDYGIPGLSGVDTRQIARMLRRCGPMRALLTTVERPIEEGILEIKAIHRPRDLVKRVSCKRVWFSRTANHRHNIVVLDLGVKRSTIGHLNQRGCNVTIVPYHTNALEVLALRPDGLLLPDGPGEAVDVPEALELVRALSGKVPMLGISLGLQIIALANGARIIPLQHPHHGGNHPVRDVFTGRVETTTQYHAMTVDSLQNTGLSISHINLIDRSVEGLANEERHILSAQFNPESVPGPRDSSDLFDQFIELVEKAKREAKTHA